MIGIQPADVRSVFNLEVEGEPEFYANGVLVHNCLQMIYFSRALANVPLNKQEKIDAMLPEELRPEAIAAEENPHRREQLHYGMVIERTKIEKNLNQQTASRNRNPMDRLTWK